MDVNQSGLPYMEMWGFPHCKQQNGGGLLTHCGRFISVLLVCFTVGETTGSADGRGVRGSVSLSCDLQVHVM